MRGKGAREKADPGSDHGHDKSIEIRKWSSLPEDRRPTMFYAGDGVSDLSAAKETDLLFAKKDKGESDPAAPGLTAGRTTETNWRGKTDLVLYCEKQKFPFVTFQDFGSIFQTVKDIVAGKTTTQAEAKGRIF